MRPWRSKASVVMLVSVLTITPQYNNGGLFQYRVPSQGRGLLDSTWKSFLYLPCVFVYINCKIKKAICYAVIKISNRVMWFAIYTSLFSDSHSSKQHKLYTNNETLLKNNTLNPLVKRNVAKLRFAVVGKNIETFLLQLYTCYCIQYSVGLLKYLTKRYIYCH